MSSFRMALSGIAASALTVLSLCVAPAASATTPLQFTSVACSVTEINYEEASFRCDFSWTGGSGPYTLTARSVDVYAKVDWVVMNGQSATAYGWCRVEKYLHVSATLTDSTGATAPTGWANYCYSTDYGY